MRQASAASQPLPFSAVSSNCSLCNQVIVFGMRSYPEPQDPIGHVDTEGAIMQAHAHGAKPPDAFETKGWVRRIRFEEFEAFIGERLNSCRESLITAPEAR